MHDLFSLEGKSAIVTGGSRGIGLMIARGFLEAGANVTIVSRNAQACDDEAKRLRAVGNCDAMSANLASEAGCQSFAEQYLATHDSLHILVNNAGATWGAPLKEFDDNAWNRTLDLNVKGVFHTTKFLLDALRATATADDPSRVINIGSIDGIQVPVMETYSYSASKAAVHQLTRHLAAKLAPEITVNAIAPGPFESKMMHATLEAFGEQIAATAPMRRIGRPDDMAGAAIYLASRAASYVTGVVLPVDGGIATTK